VLAFGFPQTQWLLIDSVEKKVAAVRGFAEELELSNVQVRAGRAEVLAREEALRGEFDGVVARAVARLVVLAELSRGFVRAGGLLAAVKGPSWTDEVEEGRRGFARVGWADVHSERAPSTVRETWLVTMRAVGPAPEWVPRRVGVPQRRPLLQ
jgi:16S rRNA (guanine527-N7)-methyltransferase